MCHDHSNRRFRLPRNLGPCWKVNQVRDVAVSDGRRIRGNYAARPQPRVGSHAISEINPSWERAAWVLISGWALCIAAIGDLLGWFVS